MEHLKFFKERCRQVVEDLGWEYGPHKKVYEDKKISIKLTFDDTLWILMKPMPHIGLFAEKTIIAEAMDYYHKEYIVLDRHVNKLWDAVWCTWYTEE